MQISCTVPALALAEGPYYGTCANVGLSIGDASLPISIGAHKQCKSLGNSISVAVLDVSGVLVHLRGDNTRPRTMATALDNSTPHSPSA